VKVGKPKDAVRAKSGTKLSRGANFECLMSGTPIASDHIYGEAQAGRMGARLMVIVAEGQRGRLYLAGGESEAAAIVAKLGSKAETARELASRLYTLCEQKKRAAEALSYDVLVQGWPEIARLVGESTARSEAPVQPKLI
jgi:adenine-specific DNA methylase